MTERDDRREPGLEVPLDAGSSTILYAERLRDGRVVLGTRSKDSRGEWIAGELQVLDRNAYLALAGWLAAAVEDAWRETVRERQSDQVRTAFELYGEGPAAIERLAREMIGQIPPPLLMRALSLLINSIGPGPRERLIANLNRTTDAAEEFALRRRLADEPEAFAYAIAGAALLDALEQGLVTEEELP